MRQVLQVGLFVTAAFVSSGCSTASYQVMQQGTWKIGTPANQQPGTPNVLQTVTSDAPGGKAAIIVVYFGASQPPIVEAKGDSSALVDATAAVGRKAFDLAVKFAKFGSVVP